MSWSSERLCAKVVSFCSERGLTEYAQFLLSDLVKRSQTTLHTASERLCGKIVSIRLKRDLIGYAPFLLSDLVKRSQTTLHTASERVCAKGPLRIQCDILERSKEFGKRREVSLMGNPIRRAARHLPAEAVHERIRGEKRPWGRQRWEIIYQALTIPRPAEDIARTVGVSLSTVHRVIATYKQGGVAAIETPGKGGARHHF